MLELLDKYDELLGNVLVLIDKSKFKKEYIISELNLTRAAFYTKLKNRSFTSAELHKLALLLFPKEAELYNLRKSIEKGLDAIDTGKVRLHKDVMSDFRKQYSA